MSTFDGGHLSICTLSMFTGGALGGGKRFARGPAALKRFAERYQGGYRLLPSSALVLEVWGVGCPLEVGQDGFAPRVWPNFNT